MNRNNNFKIGKQKCVCLFLLTFITALSLFTLKAQEQVGLRSKASQLFAQQEYANALKIYHKLLVKNKYTTKDIEELAACYYYLGNAEQAEYWYAKAVEKTDYNKKILWNYAESLKQNSKYSEAKDRYKEYAREFNEGELLKRAVAGADSALKWLAKPTNHMLRNESSINTAMSEFALYPLGRSVLYAAEPMVGYAERSGMTGQAYLRLFSASREESGLSYPNIIDEAFNVGSYHIGPIVSNASGDELYITRTYVGSQPEKRVDRSYRFRRYNLELKIYKRKGDTWLENDFPYNNVEEYSVGHASLSEDGKVLYYASDMPSGYGGVDVWYSELQIDGTWGKPKNAGPFINTVGDEMFPVVVDDMLYFASDGWEGMGGLDIFKAQGAKNSFSEALNMKYPINSPADDFAFMQVEDNELEILGYLSSNRKGGVGGDDIYSFKLKKPRIGIELVGHTFDKESGEVIAGAKTSLYARKVESLGSKLSEEDGSFFYRLDKNTGYSVVAEKDGYYTESLIIDELKPSQDTVINIALKLQPVYKVGQKIVLENFYYDLDKYNIRPDAAIILDELVEIMRKHPALKIELSSHTDCRGTEQYNQNLSQRRAEASVEYLIKRDIAKDRLVARGYGESRLVNKCADGIKCTEKQHQANRRTEIEILKD